MCVQRQDSLEAVPTMRAAFVCVVVLLAAALSLPASAIDVKKKVAHRRMMADAMVRAMFDTTEHYYGMRTSVCVPAPPPVALPSPLPLWFARVLSGCGGDLPELGGHF